METRATCFGGVFLEGMLKEGFAVVWSLFCFSMHTTACRVGAEDIILSFSLCVLGSPTGGWIRRILFWQATYSVLSNYFI